MTVLPVSRVALTSDAMANRVFALLRAQHQQAEAANKARHAKALREGGGR